MIMTLDTKGSGICSFKISAQTSRYPKTEICNSEKIEEVENPKENTFIPTEPAILTHLSPIAIRFQPKLAVAVSSLRYCCFSIPHHSEHQQKSHVHAIETQMSSPLSVNIIYYACNSALRGNAWTEPYDH